MYFNRVKFIENIFTCVGLGDGGFSVFFSFKENITGTLVCSRTFKSFRPRSELLFDSSKVG